jgi:hypothetical protein
LKLRRNFDEPCWIRTSDPLLKSVGARETKNHALLILIGISTDGGIENHSELILLGGSTRTKDGQFGEPEIGRRKQAFNRRVDSSSTAKAPTVHLIEKRMFRSKPVCFKGFFLRVRELSVFTGIQGAPIVIGDCAA